MIKRSRVSVHRRIAFYYWSCMGDQGRLGQGAKKIAAESPESVSLRNRRVMLRNSSFRAWWWVLLKKGLLGFPGGSVVKNLPAKQETQVQSLGQKDPLEKEMATHSSILAWEIPWTEDPGGLQAMGSQRVRHDLVTKQQERVSSSKEIREIKLHNQMGLCMDTKGERGDGKKWEIGIDI